MITQPAVTSGQSRVKLAISGQVNRMVNVANDGHNTKAYFVDNNNSVSRVRFDGTAAIGDELKAGTTIEIGITPNNSNDVSQDNESAGDKTDQRKVEAFLDSKRYGKVFFGKGDSSAKDIARIDLSGTDVLAYANVADMAGGLQFVDKHNNSLTGVAIKNVFTDFDFGRISRVRYDTPQVAGIVLSGTYGEDQKASGALRWAGEGAGLQAAAGVGISDPSNPGQHYALAGSGSILHEGSGLNFTLAAGERDQNGTNPTFYYVKGGWLTKLTSVGDTAFSIDYQRSSDVFAENDDGDLVGLVVDQAFRGYGAEVYGGLRWYSFQGDLPSVSDILVGTVGTRVKF